MGRIGSKLVRNMTKGKGGVGQSGDFSGLPPGVRERPGTDSPAGGCSAGGSFNDSHELSGEEFNEEALEKVGLFPRERIHTENAEYRLPALSQE